MSVTIKNETSADTYTAANTRTAPLTEAINLQVSNAAIVVQIDTDERGAGVWAPEEFYTPVVGTLGRKCGGFRFKSATPGQPAQVSATLLNAADLAKSGGDSLSSNPVRVTAAGQIGNVTNVPTGAILPFAGAAAPDGFVFCDGTHYDGTDPRYSRLWTLIGLTFGGTAQADFAVPDLRDRVAMGAGSHARGFAGGEETHTLTVAEMPSHAHAILSDSGGLGSSPSTIGRGFSAATAAAQANGGDGAHNNLQPFVAVNHIIAL